MHEALHLLIWCTVINYAMLLIWFGVFVFAHDWLYRLHSRWFKLPVETYDTFHYAGMGIYKLLIIVFNLVPLIALHFV
jgi:hypothetical protein